MIRLPWIPVALLLGAALYAEQITIAAVQKVAFGKTLEVNAKIEQLSNQKEQVVSRLGGHLERYFVQPGQRVKRGDPIALIRSLEFSKMSASLSALQKERAASQSRLASVRTLYDKGLASRQALNEAQIEAARTQSKLGALEAQLRSLGIDPASLQKETDELTIRAHAAGRIDALLVDLHTNVTPSTPLVSIVQSSGYYAVAYVPVEEALRLDGRVRARLLLGKQAFACRFLQVMPRVDVQTQRARVLFWIESAKTPLLLDYYATMRIAVPPMQSLPAVERTALTLFRGEWVVFVPAAESNASDEPAAYEPRVVVPGESFGSYVAVTGLGEGDPYVARGTWFVKSMLLKSELGEE